MSPGDPAGPDLLVVAGHLVGQGADTRGQYSSGSHHKLHMDLGHQKELGYYLEAVH